MEKSKSKFSIGERVLCFEPDQTKARVLYDAKILDADFVKEGKSRKETEYKIHFQGWNSTWDRWAGENFVLKDTEENRKLQKKLAKKAIKKLKTYGKKKVHLPGVAKVIKKCSEPLSSDSSASSDSGEDDISEDLLSSEGEFSVIKRRRKSNVSVSKFVGDVPPTPSVDPPIEEELPVTSQLPRLCPPLEIPPNLYKRLEDDNLMIKKRNKLVELPAKLTVVQILENYAKYFALYIAKLPSSEKTMKSGTQTTDFIPPEKKFVPFFSCALLSLVWANQMPLVVSKLLTTISSLNLCKETCQELRVLIDFLLPIVLLYDSEQQQYKDVVKNAKLYNIVEFSRPLHDNIESKCPTSNETDYQQESTGLSGDEAGSSSHRKELTSPPRKKTTKPTKISPHHRKTAEEQIIEETHTYLIPHQPNLDKTGLASDSQGRRRSSRLSHNLPPSKSNDDAMVASPLSGYSELSDVSSKEIPITNETLLLLRAPLNHTHGVKSRKGPKSPLPLLCRDDDRYSCSSPTISLNQMCQEVFVGSAGDDVKKAVQLSQTWKFCLFPRDYEPPEGADVPLSLIYGIHHFLRLFVKLPQVFSKTDIPDFKMKIIYKHIQLLLKFLAEYENDIYSLSGSYVNAPIT